MTATKTPRPRHKLDYVFQEQGRKDPMFTPRERHYRAQPASFALTPPAVDDQGQEGSCGPNAIDGLLKFNMAKQGMTVTPTSRQFTYYITRVLMGTVSEDSGVDNRTMLTALSQSGFAPEALWPYSQNLTAKPAASVFAAALPNRLTDYAAVEQNLQTMKACILAGHPFLFGFTCYEQLESDQAAKDGKLAMPSGQSIGGHDIVFYGYDDSMECPAAKTPGAFKFLNSWGGQWGESGSGWFPYDYATDANEAGDFWVINTVPSGGNTPTPPAPTDPKAWMDAQFAQAMKQYARHPATLRELRDVQAILDRQSRGLAGLPIWATLILNVVLTMLKVGGPYIKPLVENYLDGLNLPPQIRALIEAAIQQYLGTQGLVT